MNRNLGIGIGLLATAGLVYGGFKLRKAIKTRKELKQSREYSKGNYSTGSGGTVQTINLNEIADSIAIGLGVNRSSWDPRSWTENDTDVYNAIRVVPKALINQLSDIYFKKYKRNLRQDLNQSLDAELYAKIKSLLY
jgi:hypothetical protein